MIKNIFKNKITKQEKEYSNIYKFKFKFDNAISWAKDIIDNEDKENAVIMVDYMMETVKNDLKYSFLKEIIYSPKFEILDITRKTFIPEFYEDENGKVVNVSELFSHIYTDGVEWINFHNNKPIYKVIDFRIAILFELARLKYNISR